MACLFRFSESGTKSVLPDISAAFAKSRWSGHFIDFNGYPRLTEQSDPVQLEGMESANTE
jgi:hypothetical protein